MARCGVALLSLALALTACAPPSPGPHVQGLLDEYAPELLIGGKLSANARSMYRLEVVGHTGFRDTSFAARGGLFDLVMYLDKPVESKADKVPASVRITRVEFRIADSASLTALRARFDSALGTPTPLCYASNSGAFRYRYWPGMRDRGIDIREPLARNDSSGDRGGVGSVTFGSAKFHPDSASVIPCR